MPAIDIPVDAMTHEQLQELAVPEFDPDYRLPAESRWMDGFAETVVSEK